MKIWTLVFVVSLIGLFLRLVGSATADYNADEYAWAWAGVSLFGGHGPTSWSYLGILFHAPNYPAATWVELHGAWFPMVHPWMDHPPAFALVLGATAWLFGERTIGEVDLATIRLPVIALAAISVPLTFELGRRAVGTGGAFLAACLLAFSPVAIRFGQVAEAEVMLMPIFLAALILADIRLNRGGRWPLWGCLLLCVLAVLVKVSGVTVGLAVAAAFAMSGRFRDALAAIVAPGVGVGIFALYGAVFGWDVWVGALLGHASRRVGGLETAYALLTSNAGALSDRGPLLDWWWWLGLLAIASLRKRPQVALVVAPAVAYVAFYVVAGNDMARLYGWYRWPLFPFLYLAAGALLAELANQTWTLLRRHVVPVQLVRPASVETAGPGVDIPLDL